MPVLATDAAYPDRHAEDRQLRVRLGGHGPTLTVTAIPIPTHDASPRHDFDRTVVGGGVPNPARSDDHGH